jgi:zinc protease
MAMIAWPTPDAISDPAEYRRVDLTEQVLNLRLIDELRISQGATYSPQTSTDGSFVFPGYGYTVAAVEIPPTKMVGFFQSTSKILKDMATQGVTADELDRARKPRIEAVLKQQQTNEYWRTFLGGADLDRRRLDRIRATVDQVKAVTAEDIRKTAAKYFLDGKAWRLMVTPERTAPTAPKE